MSDNVRYFYRCEVEDGVERFFTVAYTHDISTGATSYGATVFSREPGNNKEAFRKEPHRQTAMSRLRIRPVNLDIQADNYVDVENRIREVIRELGVRGRRG